MKKLFIIIFLVVIAGLLWTCGNKNDSSGEKTHSEPVSVAVYTEMNLEERKAKLAECASCHPKEAHNEMIGPHASSYSNLVEHKAMADTSRYYPRPYQYCVAAAFEEACVSCHATANLFETNYSGLDTLRDMKFVTNENYPLLYKKKPMVRKDSSARFTGIDCLTCHLKGDKVITTMDFKPTNGVSAPCNPQPSVFFSSNTNCISCHRPTNESMVDNLYNTDVKGSMSCNTCHMEKDADGGFTHYYYWRHDLPDKQGNNPLYQVFDDIEVVYDRSKNQVIFTWVNKSTPHRFSECGELYAKLVFEDSNGDNCLEVIKRLNNKKIHDEDLKACFNSEPITGEEGLTYLPHLDDSRDVIDVECLDIVRVLISGYDKPQYWISDSLAEKRYYKELTL